MSITRCKVRPAPAGLGWVAQLRRDHEGDSSSPWPLDATRQAGEGAGKRRAGSRGAREEQRARGTGAPQDEVCAKTALDRCVSASGRRGDVLALTATGVTEPVDGDNQEQLMGDH